MTFLKVHCLCLFSGTFCWFPSEVNSNSCFSDMAVFAKLRFSLSRLTVLLPCGRFFGCVPYGTSEIYIFWCFNLVERRRFGTFCIFCIISVFLFSHSSISRVLSLCFFVLSKTYDALLYRCNNLLYAYILFFHVLVSKYLLYGRLYLDKSTSLVCGKSHSLFFL